MLTKISTKKMIKPPKTQNKKKTGFLIFCTIVISLVVLGVVMDWLNNPKEKEFYCLEYGEGITHITDYDNFTITDEFTVFNNTYYRSEQEIQDFFDEENLLSLKYDIERNSGEYWLPDFEYTPKNITEDKLIITFKKYHYHFINHTIIDMKIREIFINHKCTKRIEVFGGY